jgi:hypothetical protein
MSDQHAQGCVAASATWTAHGKRSFAELAEFMDPLALGGEGVWTEKVIAALDKLRFFPLRCPVVCVRGGRSIRRLVVDEHVLVYYVYFAPRGGGRPGRISIRAVNHAARRNPLAGVRENTLGGFETRPGWALGEDVAAYRVNAD